MRIDENGKPLLKLGACPTLLLNKCGLINLIYEETRSLSRFVQSADDSLTLQDLENKCFSLQKNTLNTDTRVDTSFNTSVDSIFDGSIDTMMLCLGTLIKMKMSLATAPVASLKLKTKLASSKLGSNLIDAIKSKQLKTQIVMQRD